MIQLIAQVRDAIPFDTPESSLCRGPCLGCSKKLIEFLDDKLCDWESRLDTGEVPNLGEISKLARMSKKIYDVLAINGFVTK
ncbi:hypothetical protein [Aliikangiella sp. G2MR2-5]|uniref:hypothetical protein n=1 Tax=Aliikangiella sp. G2MR2-5 TaxID=2788943 RepID=UPI001FEE2D3B|nr:hypothetical protein [Aliikangiella sp. G2MR2-5]